MEVNLLIHFCLALAIVLFLLIISFCLLHIFVGENCYLLAHLDILGTCTEILDILALDILDLDIVGLISCGDVRLIESRSQKFLQFARCFYDKMGKVLLICGLKEIFGGRNFHWKKFL